MNFYHVTSGSPLATIASVAKSLNTADMRSRCRILLWLTALDCRSAQIKMLKRGLEGKHLGAPAKMTLTALEREKCIVEDLRDDIATIYAQCWN